MKLQYALRVLALVLAALAFPATAGPETLEGILTTLHRDPHPASGERSRVLHFLNTADGRKLQLDLSAAELPEGGAHSLAGKRVSVTVDAFVESRLRPLAVELLDPSASLEKITGSQPFVSLLCRFKDVVAEPRPPSYFLTQLGTTSPGFNHYYREASYNTLNLDGSAVSAGWVALPQTRAFYLESGKDENTYLDEMFRDCTAVHDGLVDFSKFYGINMMFNAALDGAAWGGQSAATLDGSNRGWPSTWMPYVGEGALNTFGWREHGILAHEMSHAFGAPHSESPDGDEYGSQFDVVSSPGGPCTVTDGNYGCVGQSMNAYAKVTMGILPAARKATYTSGSQAFTIERLAQPPTANSTVMVQIPIAGTTARFYTVESRHRVGYDLNLPGDGVIINIVTPANDRPARLVVPGGGSGAGLGGDKALWKAGNTFTSTADNVTIRIDSFSATTGTAVITVNPGTTGTAGISASPATLPFGGQSMRTTAPSQAVTITNNGSTSATVSAVSATTHFAATHNCTTLAAGASCTATVTFTPTAEGNLTGTLTVTSSAGSASANLTGTGEKSLVTHYYRSILRRAPDDAGKAFWNSEATRVAGLGANVNETWFALALTFYLSPEYQAFNRNATEYVRDLYNTFFNRAADNAGLDYWTGQIAAGLPREVVLVAFMFSSEFSTFAQAIFGNTAVRAEVDTVIDFYRGLLSRLPDSAGFNFWVGQFRAAQCSGAAAVYAQVEAISAAYAGSAEYTARNRSNTQYMTDIYNAFLRRGGDLAGVQFWISQLDTGARTRSKVRQDFIASPEFSARVAAVVAQGCLR